MKEWRWDDITGHSSLSAVEVSIPMKWPFCTLLFCGWDPTLGDALDFHPFPNEAPDTFQTPERDQLPAAPCQMTSCSCGYRTAAAFWTPLSVRWEETRHGLKTLFFSRSCCGGAPLTSPMLFSFSQLGPILYCIVRQFMCESESLLMRVLYCLSAWLCELLCLCRSSRRSRK